MSAVSFLGFYAKIRLGSIYLGANPCNAVLTDSRLCARIFLRANQLDSAEFGKVTNCQFFLVFL